jgi:protein SCO1
MKKKILVYLGFFLLLFTAFFFFLFYGTDYYKVKLPVMSYVQDFSFTDQNDKPIDEHTIDGKVYVANYFFTTCKGICPKMNANLDSIYQLYKNDSDFAIISHTSMPGTDSVPLLKAYETKLIGKDPHFAAKWYFVTGTKDSLYRMAKVSYLLDNEKNDTLNIQDQFIHTQFLALIDKDRRVRGIYDGLKDDELHQLSKDIAKLLKGPRQGNIFNHSTFANNPN